ncbi:M20 family metallopeptidase [Nocardioides sp.]|uniref:M20 metallopeptidase family protein n=1 Tax=Nocardioides sp. TaxID=35761 RepID=UPI002626F84D|nr:M20 family metallopeptidase [Nocardioides sp.]
MSSTAPTPDFRAEAQDLLAPLRALRRTLHQHPEVGLDLPRTQRAVLDALDGLDLEITTGTSLTSVVAVLRGAAPGPTVLLRGDMDGLPVVEDTAEEWRSTNGAMHACGHDLHTAGLIGAARLLAAHRDQIAGTVVLMFQPGEEGWNGASRMLEEGVLDVAGERPVAAYAVHVGTRDQGLFSTRPGAVMASSNRVRVTLTGRGGHGSSPANALDPVPALAELVLAMQSMMTRRVGAYDPAVLSVTMLSAGETENVIPEKASLRGTLRTFSTATLDLIETELARLAHGIASAHGLSAEFELTRDYPVTVNDAEASARVAGVVVKAFGAERYEELPEPFMGSEDFAFVLDQVPGCYVILGARPHDVAPGGAYAHSPQVRFDDAVLSDQAALLALLAWEHVGGADRGETGSEIVPVGVRR